MSFLKKISVLVTMLFALFMQSCFDPKSPLDKYGEELKGVMRNEYGTFRGFNLGEKIDSVVANESGNSIEADEGYLYYEFKLNDSNSYSVSYNFDDEGLNEIQSDIFIKSQGDTEKVFSAFKSYFDDHFGKSETHQGYTVWTVKSDKYGDVRINLSDESSDFTIPGSPGKIALWIYPDKE